MFLRNARLAQGHNVDIAIGADGRITDIGPVHSGAPAGPHDLIEDLTGYLLLSSAAEPHAHLDKALTADLAPNTQGDLLGAIDAWIGFAPTQSRDQIAVRALRAAEELLANGVTAVRTHVNVRTGQFDAIEALLTVRDQLHGALDMQLVALTTMQLCGGPEMYRRVLQQSAALDSCVVIGGCPHLDDDAQQATDISLDVAGETNRPLDLHTDESLNPDALHLPYLAERVIHLGYRHGATASHCVSLGVLDPVQQRDISELVAGAGVAVVTLPQTNLFLQGRAHRQSTPRGLTALRSLLDAGVTLGAGADNVRDPFNLMGRSDPMETAALLVMAGHLSVAEAYGAVTDGARGAMGLPPVTIAVGQRADLLAICGQSLNDAVARADSSRIVFSAGRIVARTVVKRSTYPTSNHTHRQD